MHLIWLSANKYSFHDIKFKKGINYIIGKKFDNEIFDKKSTYNGVGKSLIIELIHFCLGSNKINTFEEILNDWEFILQFEAKGSQHTVIRSCKNQNEIYLDGEIYGLTKFKMKIMELVFDFSPETTISQITFRTLISRFIRRNRASYTSYKSYIKQESEYSSLLNDGYLLGLDVGLIEAKKENRKKEEALKKTKMTLEKDSIVKQYFKNNDDTDLQMLEIKDKIVEYEKTIAEYRIAENYNELEEEAVQLQTKRRELENKRVLLQKRLHSIKKGLKLSPNLTLAEVSKMYDEANVVFPSSVIKQLEEVTTFHDKLISVRKNRLLQQKKETSEKIEIITESIISKGHQYDEILRILDTHGALDEYNTVIQRKGELERQYQKLSEYREMLLEIELELSKIKENFEKENTDTLQYIHDNQNLIDNITGTFRGLAKQFYNDKPSGIDIKRNNGDNQKRFNIEAKIVGDSSDGINEVTIFCFDLTLLLLSNTEVRMLFHDSRLLANMDPRQRLAILEVLDNEIGYSVDSEFQYILSLNQDMITSLKDVITDQEYKTILQLIADNTILELTDESSKTKLLGIDVDLKYD